MSDNDKHEYNCSCWKCRFLRKRNNHAKETQEETNLINKNTKLNQNCSQLKKEKLNEKLRNNELEVNRLRAKYVHGLLKIQDTNGFVSNPDGNYYMNFKYDYQDETGKLSEELRNIPKFMSTIWNMKSPQIIIPIVTGVTNFKNWKNKKLEEQFRRGLIKAANKTDMWFITNGINGGLSAMIGEAFNEEKQCRATSIVSTKSLNHLDKTKDKTLTLIGIVSVSTLQNYPSFDGNSTVLTSSGNKTTGKNYRFDVNPDHSHLIIYDDLKPVDNSEEIDRLGYDQFRNKIENLFTRSLGYYKRKFLNIESEISDDEEEMTQPKLEKRKIPMVCLMIRGDLSNIEVIESKIKKEIPVVVLNGSGAVADIIAFAYNEMNENKDQDHEDNFVKPEILKRLSSEFSDDLNNNDFVRNQYRDKILSIVKNGTKGSQTFLTIIDMKGMGFNFNHLDEYILTALLKSQTQQSGKLGKSQIERNIRLTLNWNLPSLALHEIFQRDDYTQIEIKNSLFEQAICSQDREEFVELFLDQGFYIHRYLGRNNIRDLFNKAEQQEFFISVVLQGVLGHYTNELPENFLPDGLNTVLKYLTSIDSMVNILEIYMNQLGFYVTDAVQAEKKALNFLLIYAVIFNRHKLAKILWKRSENPLVLALICSLIYKNLLLYVHENYVKSQIETYQKDFADAAINVLDASFKENDPRAYSILQHKHPDWNDLTLFELAYNAKNKHFIAHPCCQKILTKRLFGDIQIRDVENGLPAGVKLTMSAFLVFPMYHWIIFPLKKQFISKRRYRKKKSLGYFEKQLKDKDEFDSSDSDSEISIRDKHEAEETKKELNKKLIKEMEKNQNPHLSRYKKSIQINAINKKVPDISGAEKTDDEEIKEMLTYEYVSPPIYEKISLVWQSPYTKFWMNFLSYLLFLAIFSLVTLWPCCGHLILDSILWLWTASIAIEETRVAYKNYLTGSQLPLNAHVMQIGIMISFLFFFFMFRIIGSWDSQLLGIDRIFSSKVLLCFYLLFFYYRTVFTFLPISHQLGPMLVMMKMMIKNDFMSYLRLLLIFVTACGIALNAILYPFHPLNAEFIKKTFLFRGILQIFVLDKDELETPSADCLKSGLSNHINQTYQCVDLTQGIDFSYTKETLSHYGVNYKCVQPSLFAWFIFIQYFFLIKLFLPTLLVAMFSRTTLIVEAEAEQLWMFQRYEIVVEYEKRLPFGPPFTIFCYFYMMMKNLIAYLKSFTKSCRVCCSCYCFTHLKENLYQDETTNKASSKITATPGKLETQTLHAHSNSRPGTNVFNYWRNIAQKYSYELEKEQIEKKKHKKVDNTLNKVQSDLGTQKKSMQRLNARVINLEQSLQTSQSYLEQIKNLLTTKESKNGLADRKLSNYIHILSRESPYLNTNIPRFFIYEKLVSWDCQIDLYDPPFISLPAETFKVDKIFIDEDLNTEETNMLLPPVLQLDASRTRQNSNNQDQAPGTPRLSQSRTSLERNNGHRSRQNSAVSRDYNKHNYFMWNCTISIDDPRMPNQIGKNITIDRKSWITKYNETNSNAYPVIYSLDGLGYPKNPMGRTGVRGRGALMRYGPNKEIMAIVTRWKQSKNRPIFVERRKLLEFIAIKDQLTGSSKIPGDKILGDESQYSVVCRTFMEIVFDQTDIEKGCTFSQDDMTKFFCSFASKSAINFSNSSPPYDNIFEDYGFMSTMIYSGYIDDPRNTDNAWIEAEIWNFHYDKLDSFDSKINNPQSKWREVSSNIRINSNEIISDALKEIAETHNGFYS